MTKPRSGRKLGRKHSAPVRLTFERLEDRRMMTAAQPIISTIPGDYNDDGAVDAVDYNVWRENLGAQVRIPNDATPGLVDEVDYAVWKANFGAVRAQPAEVDWLPGDYNADGTVDGADYSVWRENLGANIHLPNDATPGVVGDDDYLVWKANFGTTISQAGDFEWLPGDYNDDGIVDSSDYSVWRDNRNQRIDLVNDVTPGVVDDLDYLVWKANFGTTLAGLGQAEGPVIPPLETPWTPIVSAGPDKTVDVGANLNLNADVIVNQPDNPQYTWSMVSGPGSVNFGNGNSEDTSATFSAPGSYVLQLTVTNHGVAASDRVTVNVQGQTAGTPELPREYINTDLNPAYNRAADIIVRAGDNLQAALDAAQPGNIIELQAGATFTGNFVLRNKPGDAWIYIRSSAHAQLPAPGTRVTPAQANLMPKIVSANSMPSITTEFGAHHYRLIGLEVTTTASMNYGVIVLGTNPSGNSATTLAQLPHHMTFDRMYIHGTPTGDIRRGIAMNSRHTAVIDSYLSDFHERGADSQAIAGWGGDGPFKIVNNYLEAAGENVMFGGADPEITNLVPSDIEIRGNHFFKPLSWRVGDPVYAGIPWVIKNSFELKSAQRMLIEGNVFENNWGGQGQSGSAIVLTPRNQDGGANWSTVQDVVFRSNIIRNTHSGIHLLSSDYNYESQALSRILFEHNLLLSAPNMGGGGRLTLMVVGPKSAQHIVFRHNTLIGPPPLSMFMTVGETDTFADDFTWQDNITSHGEYGLHSPAGLGAAGLDAFMTRYTFIKNVIIANGASMGTYPSGNFTAATNSTVKFADFGGGDFRLDSDSPYKNAATDGTDIGADITSLLDMVSDVTSFSLRASATFNSGTAVDRQCVEQPNSPAQPVSDWFGMSAFSQLPASTSFDSFFVHAQVAYIVDAVFQSVGQPVRIDLIPASNTRELIRRLGFAEVNELPSNDATTATEADFDFFTEISDTIFAGYWNAVSF